VGQLVEMGIKLGRATRPKLKVGICGEHGGEPNSVEFCHIVGMDYVSCSPFRVPIARLAAAQAQLTHPRGTKPVAGKPKGAAKLKPKAKTRPKAKPSAKKPAARKKTAPKGKARAGSKARR
jgi:phosphoenolpyruvate-protein kinase (PTS system EI component)